MGGQRSRHLHVASDPGDLCGRRARGDLDRADAGVRLDPREVPGYCIRRTAGRSILAWIWFPCAGLVIVTGLPLHARFLASRSALTAEAQRIAAEPEAFPARPLESGEPRWIGLYPINRAEAIPGGARFVVADTGFVDLCGFAWSPEGEPANVGGEDRYLHFHGDWWTWRESW
jgi:hypothetical protein